MKLPEDARKPGALVDAGSASTLHAPSQTRLEDADSTTDLLDLPKSGGSVQRLSLGDRGSSGTSGVYGRDRLNESQSTVYPGDEMFGPRAQIQEMLRRREDLEQHMRQAEEVNRDLRERLLQHLRATRNEDGMQPDTEQEALMTLVSHFATVNLNRRRMKQKNLMQRLAEAQRDDDSFAGIEGDILLSTPINHIPEEQYVIQNPEELMEEVLPQINEHRPLSDHGSGGPPSGMRHSDTADFDALAPSHLLSVDHHESKPISYWSRGTDRAYALDPTMEVRTDRSYGMDPSRTSFSTSFLPTPPARTPRSYDASTERESLRGPGFPNTAKDLIRILLKGSQPIYDEQKEVAKDHSNYGFDILGREINDFDKGDWEAVVATKKWLDSLSHSDTSSINELDHNKIKMISLEKLVELLTRPETKQQLRIVDIVLTTHHSFCDSLEFFNLLVKRFFESPPPNLCRSEQNALAERRCNIWIKIINILHKWISKHWDSDWRPNKRLLGRLDNFVKKATNTRVLCDRECYSSNYGSNKKPCRHKAIVARITKLVERKKKKQGVQRQPTLMAAVAQEFSNAPLISIDHKDIATAITVLTVKVFKGIHPRECIKGAWKKSDKQTRAPHILKLIQYSNGISEWFMHELLKDENAPRRAETVTWVIKLLGYLLGTLNNLSSAKAVYDSLGRTPVFRLRTKTRLFKDQSREEQNTLKGAEALFAKRDRLLNHVKDLRAKRAALPPINVLLDQLHKIEEFYKDKNKAGMVNFQKCGKMEEQILNLKMFQVHNWELKYDTRLLTYVNDQIHRERPDDEEFHKMSKRIIAEEQD